MPYPLLAVLGNVTPEQLAALGGTGVLAFVVILLLRGDLVPRWSHERVVKALEREVGAAERDRERWERIAMDALDVTEAAVGRKK